MIIPKHSLLWLLLANITALVEKEMLEIMLAKNEQSFNESRGNNSNIQQDVKSTNRICADAQIFSDK